MGWVCAVVVVVICVAVARTSPPSALHDPQGYDDFQTQKLLAGCLALIAVVVGALLILTRVGN